ncbi:MAG: EamA family transporter, partial [Verrucomicrobiota bacterium]
MRDQLKLQFVIFIWGFTSVIGHERFVSLPAVELVFYRTAIAALVLGGVLGLYRRSGLQVSGLALGQMLGTGVLIAIHWILFFLSVKVSSVSICVVGISTLALWSALL